MPLTGVHFLLSYQCTHECDHCFVWSSPRAGGTLSLEMLTKVLDQALEMGTVNEVYFEGGEPFLFYPLMIEGIRQAKERGFSTGVVTNCYWATAEADAALWLEPLAELEVADLSVSSDAFHGGDDEDPRPGFAVKAAQALGLDEAVITIDPPTVCTGPDEKGLPIVGGSVRFRGRAAVNLTADLPAPAVDRFRRVPRRGFFRPRPGARGRLRQCSPLPGAAGGQCEEDRSRRDVRNLRPAKPPGHRASGGGRPCRAGPGLRSCPTRVDTWMPVTSATRRGVRSRERFPEYLGPPNVYGAEEDR